MQTNYPALFVTVFVSVLLVAYAALSISGSQRDAAASQSAVDMARINEIR